MTSPFRDELESLRRENEALRAQLVRPRRPRAMAAFVLAGVDVGAAVALRPWLNADSDARFWGALAILGVITLAVAGAAIGYKRRVV